MARNNDEKFERGVKDFNAGRFFEAHEVWEELWLAAAGLEKTFLQGLIQVAAAFHHRARGNVRGTQSLLVAGIAKLARCPADYRGLAIAKLRSEAEAWETLLRSEKDPGSRNLPKIHEVTGKATKRKRGG
ncbi:MAG: DUF309 domain-containing protein [Candidatus Acidiferrales bacterium]